MTPKNTSPKPPEEPVDQGQLFPVEVSRTAPPKIGEVVEGGVYPDQMPGSPEGTQPFHEAVHEAVVKEQQTRNRRAGNQGKHSPLQREGNYQQIRVGDFLPGFGPVTERKWEEAKAHARKLEAERVRKADQQPKLFDRKKDVTAVVEQVADELDIRHGIEATEQARRTASAADVGYVALNPERRRAFGSVPRLLRDPGTDRVRIEALTAEDYARVDPEFLQKSYYTKHAEWSYNGLALNRDEFATLLLNPRNFEERIAARAARGHQLSNPVRQAEVKISAPLHAYERLQEKHVGVVNGLIAQHERLMELAAEAQSPGFAHKKEADLVVLANEAWELGFNNLLDVAARTNGLSPEQQESMEWAMYDKLINGSQREKIAYWQQMLAVSINYANARRLTMMSSYNRVTSQVKTLQKRLDAFTNNHGIYR